MSFETEVTLGIEVDQGSLRNAKQAIEDELGDVMVGVDGGAASRATGGGGAGGMSASQNRRIFRWARQRTNAMDDMVGLLENIEDGMGGGGAFGGGGGGGGGIRSFFTGLGAGSAARSGGSVLGRIGSTAAGAAGGAASTLAGALSGGAGLAAGAPAAGLGLGLLLTLGTGRNQEALDRFNQEQQRRERVFGGGGRLGPGGGGAGRFTSLLTNFASGNIQAPPWAERLLGGDANAPPWVRRFISGGGTTAFGPRSPNAPGAEFGPRLDISPEEADTTTPGGAQRIEINFEQQLDAMGITPEEAEALVDDKLSEVEREIARNTGRGAGGTRIP